MKECEQFPGRLRDLCEGRGREGRGDPPRYAVDAFRAKNGLWPLGATPYPDGVPRLQCPPFAPRTVAVVLICHNYGRFLPEALESVLAQTRKPDEILVIDDSSTDDTEEVAKSYVERGVAYLRVEVKNVHQARWAGFEATKSEGLCFLDADDKLSPEYLELGLAQFTEARVAVVYSDVEHFGNRSGRSNYPEYDPAALQRDNFIHSGSIVRREAIDIHQPFAVRIDPHQTQADWFLWRRVLQGNWIARKQHGTYFYRQHQSNWSHVMRRSDSPQKYFAYAGLRHERVTLFVPLSGRKELWPQMASFLNRQTWPHDQISLVLLDTSRDVNFQLEVRSHLARCDYPDIRHLTQPVEDSGLADENRHDGDIRHRVVRAMWRIYDRLPRLAATEYVWVLEDDILPPDDVCQRLLHAFDVRTMSVTAAYRSRYHAKFVVWDQQGREFAEPGTQTEIVGGNGFGCVMLRRSVIANQVFTRHLDTNDYDNALYRKLAHLPFVAKVDWTCVCEHGPEMAAPSVWRKMVNFSTAVARHAADGLKKVDDATFDQRLAICGKCPSCDSVNWICREKSCGCHLKIKAGWRSESCPLGKWFDNVSMVDVISK